MGVVYHGWVGGRGVVYHAGFACGGGVVGHRVEGWLWVLWIDPFNRVWRNKIFHNGGFGVYISVYT